METPRIATCPYPMRLHRRDQIDNFIDGEASARHIAGAAVDAIDTVVQTKIGQQNFEQRDAAAVRRITVTDSQSPRGTHARPGAAERLGPPLLAQEASYFAASANTANLRSSSILVLYPVLCLYPDGAAATHPHACLSVSVLHRVITNEDTARRGHAALCRTKPMGCLLAGEYQ